MKALIVDDEKHTRKLLRNIIRWDDLGIESLFDASNVEDATQIIQLEKPEIILTDMRMSGGDGVELLQWLSQHKYPSKVIVISAYDTFDFMQKTIQYGGFDYLIKPIHEEKANETIGKAVKEWLMEDEKRKKELENRVQMNETLSIYSDYLLTLLSKQNNAASALKLTQQLSFIQNADKCTIALLKSNMDDDFIAAKPQGDGQLFNTSLVSIANEMIGYPHHGAAFRFLDNEQIVGVIAREGAFSEQLCERLWARVQHVYGISIEIALAPHFQFPEGLRDSYHAALHILEQRNLLNNRASHTYTVADLSPIKKKLLLGGDSDVKEALFSGEYEQINRSLSGFLEEIEKAGVLHRKQIELWESELVLFQEQFNEAKSIQRWSLTRFDMDGHFTLQHLKTNLLSCLWAISKQVSPKFSTHQRAENLFKNYIEENYAKPLNIQSLSQTFHFNSEYISRRFKQAFGISIIQYLHDLRINKAKSLLISTKMKMHEIAHMVGYNDEKYFSKLFYKCIGYTPREYRDKFRA